jgi:hypothetical protein
LVAFLDADEFIDTRRVAGFREFLSASPSDQNSVDVELWNYDAPKVETQHEVNMVKRFVRRLRAPIDVWKVFVRGMPDHIVAVDAGSHSFTVDGRTQSHFKQKELSLAHFPNRSPWHWVFKAVSGSFKVLASGQRELKKSRSSHYRDFYDTFRQEPEAWVERAHARFKTNMTSPDLIDDPIEYLGGELRYTQSVDYAWRAFSLGLANMEELAGSHGRELDRSPELLAEFDSAMRELRPLE